MMNRFFKILNVFIGICSAAYAQNNINTGQILIKNPAEKTGGSGLQKIYITKNNETDAADSPSPDKEKKADIAVLNNGNSVETKGDSRLIAKLTVTKTTPEQIKKVKKRMEQVQKALAFQKKPVGINRNIKFIKGQEVNIKIKAGFTTLVNFVDDAGNPVKFTYLTIGNNFIKVAQFGNKLEIKPLRTYSSTNLIVGIKGYDYPVTLNIQETGDDGDEFDNYVNIVLTGTFAPKVGDDSIKIKSAILQYIFKYSRLESLPQINYEVYSLKTQKPVLFSKNVLKIYKVKKFGKTYYLILINKNFSIYSNKTFGTYNSAFNIYFLNFNQNVFTIRTNPKLNMPYPMVERYRIVIKDF